MSPEHFASGIPIFCAFTEVIPAESLKPNPKNPREHPEAQLDRYETVIQANGWRRPVVVSARSGYIVKGHGAYLTALRRGWEIPVEIQPYNSEKEETRDLLADNHLSALAQNDNDKLRELLSEIGEAEISFAGFDKVELDHILQAVPVEAGKIDAVSEWSESGMPPCENEDQAAWDFAHVNFRNEADRKQFEKLLDCKAKRRMWFPSQPLDIVKELRYVASES